jgi:hypothetical protein
MRRLGLEINALVLVLAVAVGALASGALAANTYRVDRLSIRPDGRGSVARPLPIGGLFSLSVGDEDPLLRPAPLRAYVLGSEGVRAFPEAFPHCGLRALRRWAGVPRRCERARVGSGRIKAAAGLAEDVLLSSSVPCNVRLRVYNTGRGMALRLDARPPIPPRFGSDRLGCPVPVHTAVVGRFSQTRIDGMPSTDVRFRLPDLFVHPIEGWEGALRRVRVKVELSTARATVAGRPRRVGYYSAVGCNGERRTVRVGFIDEAGKRIDATRDRAC